MTNPTLYRRRIIPDDETERELNLQIHLLEERIIEKPSAAITYFVPDEHKEGGQYVTLHGRVRRIDYFDEMLILTDGKKIKLGDILEIRLKDRAEDV